MNIALTKSEANLVGLGRLELPTSPLSGVRSNQLSYRPIREKPTLNDRPGQTRTELTTSPTYFHKEWGALSFFYQLSYRPVMPFHFLQYFQSSNMCGHQTAKRHCRLRR